MPAPDLILHNGRVHTLEAVSRTVGAIAIHGEQIVAVGSRPRSEPRCGRTPGSGMRGLRSA